MKVAHRVTGRIGGSWIVLAVLAALGLVSAAWAAQLALTHDALNGSATVTVQEKDGKSVRGTIKQCTPELLYILPPPVVTHQRSSIARMPSNMHMPAGAAGAMPSDTATATSQPSAVEIPWKNVQSVSDGLTARLALDIWRSEHAADLCPTCHGERTVWCPVCKGTRHDPASAADCKTCKGELLVDCKSAAEVDGQIPCPNGCLRLSVGNWKKGTDGLMWRNFRVNNGTVSISEHHLGQMVIIDPRSLSNGLSGVCPVCGGTIKVDDPLCFGTGKVPCPECLARKAAPPCPNNCDNGRVVCPTCGGTGLKKS